MIDANRRFEERSAGGQAQRAYPRVRVDSACSGRERREGSTRSLQRGLLQLRVGQQPLQSGVLPLGPPPRRSPTRRTAGEQVARTCLRSPRSIRLISAGRGSPRDPVMTAGRPTNPSRPHGDNACHRPIAGRHPASRVATRPSPIDSPHPLAPRAPSVRAISPGGQRDG